jgi:putative CocE/NonD family hydrolase
VAGTANDTYPVNFTASTGNNNRWMTEIGLDILYPDRSGEDSKLLVYTGAPLATDVEISGSPAVILEVAPTATDGAFFGYLEDVAPDGHVSFLDEGELRSVNRKPMETSARPYDSPCLASGSSLNNAEVLVPGKPVELRIRMWPTSVLLRKDHQIRIALAGADAGTFRRYPPGGDVTWTVYRQSGRASYGTTNAATLNHGRSTDRGSSSANDFSSRAVILRIMPGGRKLADLADALPLQILPPNLSVDHDFLVLEQHHDVRAAKEKKAELVALPQPGANLGASG